MIAPKSYITEDLVEQVAIVSYEQSRIQNVELPMPSWAGAGAFNRYQHKVDIAETLKLILPVMIEQGWKAPEPRDEIQGDQMTDQAPLNPDALARHQWAHDFNSCDCGKSIPTIIDSENCVYVPNDKAMAMHQIEMATAAQPAVNSVEGILAQVQVISWEEEPEHECWKLAPDETFVGLIVKSDRAWSPADKYTLNIQCPEVDDA